MATATQMTFYRRDGAGFPVMRRYPEESGQTTLLKGVPVYRQAADGMVAVVTDNFSNTEIVLGVSAEEGHNLTTQDTAEELSAGTPPNQSSASIIPIGAPLSDGKIGVIHADGGTEFKVAAIDTQTVTDAMALPGTQYELESQSNDYWAVDTTDTATDASTDHVVEIVEPYPNDAEFAIVRFAVERRVDATT